MLKTTSQQIIDDIGIGPTEVGRPVVIGSIVDGDTAGNDAGNTILKAIPEGHVFLCTKILASTNGAWVSGVGGSKATNFLSPNVGPTGEAGFVQIDFGPATLETDTIKFQRWARYNTLFGEPTSPTWISAPPSNVAEWKPKYPIAIGAQWQANTDVYDSAAPTTFKYGDWAPGMAMYGVIVPESTAHQYGYTLQTSGATGPVATGPVKYGVASWNGEVGEGGGPIIAGVAGYRIRILDIHIRMQPTTNALASLRLGQGEYDGEEQAQIFFKIVNSNPAEPIEKQFSPEIILKAGEDLSGYTDAEDQFTVNVHYELVPEDDAPKDLFFGVLTPENVTPADGANIGPVGKEVFDQSVQGITLYFPGYDTSETSSGEGFQYIVRGFAFSAQKDGNENGPNDDVDQQLCAISVAPSTSTAVAFAHENVLVNIPADSNAQMISPVFAFCGHDQNLTVVADDLNAPAPADNGVVRFDYISFNAKPDMNTSSPVPARYDGNITDWAVSVWGRRIPTAFTAGISRTV